MRTEATLSERAKLIEAALRSSNPVAFLTGLQSAFQNAGRHEDFETVTMLRNLLENGEIERLFYLKAQWQKAPIGPDSLIR